MSVIEEYDKLFIFLASSQADAFSGGSGNISRTFGYNPASQIAADVKTSAAYAFPTSQVGAVNRDYAVNGLNQYTSTSTSGTTTASFSYDANGNLISDGSHSYTYDVENRLVKAVSGGVTTNLTYDPAGRLYEVANGSSDTRFFYDGDAMVIEYDANNVALNRYVHGSNAAADDPLVWYEGSGLLKPHWLHADHLGSIMALTDSSGANPTINTYDEYGINGAANNTAERFGYTGQSYISELGLYYYKARFYSPSLGRFLQTDPIGYKDQVNLYEYVGDDPANGIDPSGQTCSKAGSQVTCEIALDKSWSRYSRQEQRQLVRLIKNYTIAAARADYMASKGASVTVPAGDGKPSYQVGAKEVRDNLFDKKVSYVNAFTSYANADTGLGMPITVYKNSTVSTDSQQQITFLHEGLHGTGSELRAARTLGNPGAGNHDVPLHSLFCSAPSSG